jgi:hypothetical protein
MEKGDVMTLVSDSIMPSKDMTQIGKILMKPEIRVWFHPNSGKSDYWIIYPTIKTAKEAIATERVLWAKGAADARPEDEPLIAYLGMEYSIKGFQAYWKEKMIK